MDFAHIHTESHGEDFVSRADGSVIGDEQESASIANPVANDVAFCIGESGFSGVRKENSGPQGIGDH
jgi:hypothetical protein